MLKKTQDNDVFGYFTGSDKALSVFNCKQQTTKATVTCKCESRNTSIVIVKGHKHDEISIDMRVHIRAHTLRLSLMISFMPKNEKNKNKSTFTKHVLFLR